MKTLAIIPARGGSKGVKDKNIRLVAGMPLIYYAIECAQQSKLLNKTIVSTDSNAIAEIARLYGSEVLMRQPDLATDEMPITPVLLQVIQELEDQGEFFDLVILLQVTSPIREGKDIDAVIKIFEENLDIENVVSVVAMDDIHPARMYSLKDHDRMISLDEKWEKERRQQLPVVYFRNGCIYAIRTNILRSKKSILTENKNAYVMPKKWLINIDDERDLIIADVIMKFWKENKNEKMEHFNS